ncbi:MAG: hypothetical protein ACF8PN_15705 [Phycisphaerales bacterium]
METGPGLIFFQCLTFLMVVTAYSVGLALLARWDTTTTDLCSGRTVVEGTVALFVGTMLVLVSMPGETASWTQFLPPVVTAVALVGGLGLWVHERVASVRRNRRSRENRCVRCGYDLTAHDESVCPECGAAVFEKGKSE